MRGLWGAACAVCAMMSATAAYADDSMSDTNWQGFYGGAALGGVYGKSSPDTTVSDGTYFDTLNIDLLNNTFQQDVDGFAISGSGLLGYNVQDGNLVYGIEADLTAMNYSKTENSGPTRYNTVVNDFFVSTKVESKFSFSIRPRVGYSFGDTMIHVAAGPSVSRFNYKFNFSDDASPAAASFSTEETVFGVSSNIGVSHQIGDGWSLRGDYVMTYYPDIVDGSNLLSAPAGNDDVFSHDADFQSHNIRVGLIKRF